MLHDNKRSKTGSGVIVDTPCPEVSWLKDVQFTSIASWEAGWFKYGGASDAGGGFEVVVVYLPVLDELELLFKTESGGQGMSVPSNCSYGRNRGGWRMSFLVYKLGFG